MEEQTHRYNLNIPVTLWEKIKALAQANRRHTSQEILIAIEFHCEAYSHMIALLNRGEQPE